MSENVASKKRYLILPMKGLRSPQSTSSASFFLSMPRTSQMAPATAKIGNFSITVLDELNEDGAKLIEATSEELLSVRTQAPGIRIIPEVFFDTARAPRPLVATAAVAPAAPAAAMQITVNVTAPDGSPVVGANVVAFTDFASKAGAQGTTDATGTVRLSFSASASTFDRVYVYPFSTLWPTTRLSVAVSPTVDLVLRPIDLSALDFLRTLYGQRATTLGANVKVGVIDTGIALTHPDLTVAGGLNTVVGEDPTAFGDNGGEGHGSHCAGIVAAHGTPPTGVRGLAPAIELMSYRVFPAVPPGGQAAGASNYSIMKAIDAGVQSGCHLLSLSLGGPDNDEATATAISDAWQAGTVCVIAAGNDSRGPVSYPAQDQGALAISAMGRENTFPTDSPDEYEILRPPTSNVNPLDFIAGFSNFGPQIAFTAPGVGIISCIPPDKFGAMSGTSMATPAVTGFIAAAISGAIASMPPDANRSAAIVQAAVAAAQVQGFGPTYEGHGLPV